MFMDKLIRKAKEAVGKGEYPNPKVEFARKKTTAKMDLNKFMGQESSLQERVDFFRAKAKKALKEGNSREYDVLKPQIARFEGQLKVASASVDAARNIIGVMESQDNMAAIVDMGKSLAQMQADLGIDPAEIENAATTIRSSMENAENMTQTLSSIADVVTNGESLEMGDPLKAELMAEIQSESAVNGFGDTIKDKLKEFE
jgi:hypothetical protein